MDITFTPYGLEALQRGFAQAPEVTRRELLAAMTEATMLLQSDIQGDWPTHTGVSRGSITSDAFSTAVGVIGEVGSAAPVVRFVELGTKPHFPPMEPLIQWVAAKLGKTGPEGEAAARGIQRKIGYRGSKGKFIFSGAMAKRSATVQLIFDRAAGRVALHLYDNGGSIT